MLVVDRDQDKETYDPLGTKIVREPKIDPPMGMDWKV